MSRTYPDQAELKGCGRGSGFSNMGRIIHDFVDYNERVALDFSPLFRNGLTGSQQRLIDTVVEAATERGLPIYAVGGLPRDLWLGASVTDLDLVVEGDAVELGRVLVSRYAGKLTIHPRFGTAKWDLRGTRLDPAITSSSETVPVHAGHFLDLISARSETYRHAAALPTVKRGTIDDDVRRRDFTINTLAVRLDGSHSGQVLDAFGALEDLERRSVRVLHARSFVDDPTRLYRAVRYEQRFGFTIADDTLALMPAARELVGHLSGQRIRHELDLILDEPHAADMLARLARLKLLAPVHSALPHGRAAFDRVECAGQRPGVPVKSWSVRHAAWLLWLMELKEPRVRVLGRRLRMPAVAVAELAASSRLYRRADSLARLRPSKATAFLDKFPQLAVYTVSLVVKGKPQRMLQEYLAKWKDMRPLTTGHHLKELGLPPGPVYRSILRTLRDAWIDGDIRDEEGERRMLQRLVARGREASPGQSARRPARARRAAQAQQRH